MRLCTRECARPPASFLSSVLADLDGLRVRGFDDVLILLRARGFDDREPSLDADGRLS